MTSHPTLRFDATTGDWVVFSEQRSDRPLRFASPPSLRPSTTREASCPFCPGNEAETPPAVDLEPEPSDPERWLVRVFPNRYPALVPEAPLTRERSGPFFREMGGHGVHEVMVYSADHGASLGRLPVEQVTTVLRVLHRRYRVLEADPALEVVQLFENRGARAGASLPHPHMQLIGAPVVPRQVRLKYSRAEEYYHLQGVSLYADLCRAELDARTRIVSETDDFVVFAPYASRIPFETWIVPKVSAPNFGWSDESALPSLASTLRELLGRLHVALGDPAYNLTFFGAPRRHSDEPDFVWHIEVLPRLAIAAGFELATGMAINTVMPEVAAETLRNTRWD